jgi:hypothetical protein
MMNSQFNAPFGGRPTTAPPPFMTLTKPAVDEHLLPAEVGPATSPFAPRREDLVATSLVVGVYAVLSVLANWDAWTMGATRALQNGQDPKLDAWTLAWTPFALGHGVNPLFSHWVNVPFGANYAARVAIPLLALVASPITAVWGPVAATNFIISFSFFASAVAGYCFVRHWTQWRPAAFFGGLLFGFSPYVVAEGSRTFTRCSSHSSRSSSSSSTRSSSGSASRRG